jgi:hypothetical protein
MKTRYLLMLAFLGVFFFTASLSHAATATYTYDSLNRVIKEEYVNGLVIEYTYDAVGNRLTSHSYMKSFQITVDTAPSGLQITVDSVNYTAPHVFTWEAQSAHTLNVPTPQSGGAGTQFVFAYWNDAGAQSHSINTPPVNVTLTAYFETQNLLTMDLSPAGSGTITPTPAGTVTTCPQYLCEWYSSGTLVTLTAAPGSGHYFYNWLGDCSGAGACLVTLNAPRTVTATFLPLALQDRLPTSRITLQSPWSTVGCTTTTAYQCVDDPIGSPNNATDYVRVNNSANRQAIFGFSAFTVPSGSTIAFVRVTYVAIANTTSATTIKAALRVGGSVYTPAAAQTLSTTWTTYSYDWTTNPKTGAAWTVGDVNGGTGMNALQGMGVVSGTGDESVTQVYVTVSYQPAVDTVAPANTTGANFINGGAASTSSPAVTLAIAGTDAVGVTGYYASESAATPSAGAAGWVAVTSTTSYAATVPLTLSAGDGTKTVYVWLKDAVGNVSAAVSDTISFDATAPIISAVTAGSLTAGGATITWTTNEPSDSQVDYGLDATYGNSTTLNPALVTNHSAGLSGLTPLTLYHYRVKSRDAAGNLAVGGDFTMTTTADTTAPANTTGANFINSGAVSTAGPAVTLAIAGTDAIGVTGYYASESAAAPAAGAPGWVAVASTTSYSATVNFTLSAGEGTKTVYVWLKDAAGNVSAVVSDTIVLDTTPPVISNVQAVSITSSGATITWTTNEPADSQVNYGLTTSYGSSTTLNASLVTSHSQALTSLMPSTTYHYQVKSKDGVGNSATSGDNTLTTAGISTQSQVPASTTTLQAPWTGTGTGCTTTATAYLCVNDPIGSPNNGTNYIRDNNNSGRSALFGFPAFTVPTGATILYVRVTFVAIANTASTTTLQAALLVGGGTVPSAATAKTLSQSWSTYTTDWTTNPKSGQAWTVSDVNGTSGGSALRGMGVVSGSGDESVTQVYVTVGYQ